ncbi:hypothetical protein Taro_030459, partial [Colocasia esculenta]|nr:hypothetical protein [Colocasia esculenta]
MPGQRVVTVFHRFSHLTCVRVAGVSVRPVALSRRPWGTRSCCGVLTRRVKIALGSLKRRVAASRLGCRRLKALAGDPFSLSLFPLSSLPLAVLCLPLFPLCILGEEEGRAWCRGVGLGGSACGPSTLWRSEVAVLMVRHHS